MPDNLKVVSLIASATEIACALGLKEQLVGRSHECDFPADVKSLPMCSEPLIDVHGTSAEIDAQIRALAHERAKNPLTALSVYRVDGKKLAGLRPDVILTQTQCEVCAVSLRDVESALKSQTGIEARIVPLATSSLEDLWTDIMRAAQACGVAARGEALVSSLKARVSRIEDQAKGATRKPTVAALEWMDPIMFGGNWMPELIAMAGGIPIISPLSKGKYPDRIPEADQMVIFPCGFDMTRTLREIHCLTQKPWWKDHLAVKAGHVFVADGNQYFNRPGPRLVETLEILAEIIHPEIFPKKHEKSGYIKFLGKESYNENGATVFTEEYHLRRGECCGNGCRHCPY